MWMYVMIGIAVMLFSMCAHKAFHREDRRLRKAVSLFILGIMTICVIEVPFVVKKMKGSNYSFSDRIELQAFSNDLHENEVPYEEVSDTTIYVKDTWKEKAEKIYGEFMESENG